MNTYIHTIPIYLSICPSICLSIYPLDCIGIALYCIIHYIVTIILILLLLLLLLLLFVLLLLLLLLLLLCSMCGRVI